MVDLNLTMVDSVNISPEKTYLSVQVDGAQDSDVLEAFSVADVISHFGVGDLLDEIGKDAAVDHFGIQEAE